MFKRRSLLLLALVLQLMLGFTGAPHGSGASAAPRIRTENEGAERRRATVWRVEPSFKYDLLCLLNILTGDAFYLRYYVAEYSRFQTRLAPPVRKALANLKRKLKDDNGNIISAFLALHFSATDDETLDEMLRSLADSQTMRSRLRRTSYYSEDGWRLFESVRGDLRTVLRWLKRDGFEAYWREHILPGVQQRSREVQRELAKYDVVTEVEKHLGARLPTNELTVFMLYYARPHGIKLTGPRFICDASYPLGVVVQNAVHEMMHPPYRLARDRELTEALDALRADRFLMDKVKHHNPSFGYNSFESFIEEDCVRALEQLIGERLGIAEDARQRWRAEDDGMHVFAAALYGHLKRENYPVRWEPFRDFLLRTLRTGALRAGGIKGAYDAFYEGANPRQSRDR